MSLCPHHTLSILTGLWSDLALGRITMDGLAPDSCVPPLATCATKLCHTLSSQPSKTIIN